MGPTLATIGDHAALGDGHAIALVTRGGTLDWLCWPRFDSPPVFASLLDPAGGAFTVAPVGASPGERRYLPGTNVLETRFRGGGAEVALVDLMPISDGGSPGELVPEHEVLRLARCERGEAWLEVTLDPRPRWGRAPRRWRDAGKLGLRLEAGGELLAFRSEPALALAEGGGVRARVHLRAGETARFSLTHAVDGPAVHPPLGEHAEEVLARTVAAWRAWRARLSYDGPFAPAVERSALALKLMGHAPSGSIVAAPTTSLPEQLGGPLNWDYRYCWLRDASLTARALYGLGCADEAEGFVAWLLHSTRLTRPALRVLYDVYGRAPRREVELDLAGYAGSRPVRVGNGARDQLQLDVYGEVVDAAAQLVRHGVGLGRETGRMLAAFGEYVCRHWREPDEGLWEPRGGRRHHVHSKALCWATLDRLLRLHEHGHLPGVDAARLAATRAEVRATIEQHGWSEARQSYVEAFGSEEVDAALLQLPWYGYAPAASPRMRATFACIERDLGCGRGLLRRYRTGAGAVEGAFGVCGFWAAEYLALGGGSAEDAASRIEVLLSFANDVGLFAEEIDPATGDALGNFPQAFTHVGLVNACLTLRDRITGRGRLDDPGRSPAARDEVCA